MKNCIGEPAESLALAYIDGSLPEAEVEQFEEHYFDCPVCLEHLQALQAVRQQLAKQPPVQFETVRSKGVISWPVQVWGLGAVAALTVLSVLGFHHFTTHHGQASQAHNTTPPAQSASGQPNSASASQNPIPQPTPSSQPQVSASQLADLAMPAFIAPNLRGEAEDAQFLAGMRSYSADNCRDALATLSQVPDSSAQARAARFYSGVCQMHLGNLAEATTDLREVAKAGDSPEQESALYYLAQTALLGNDLGAVHRYLLRTIELQGDLERRARLQDGKVLALIQAHREAADGLNRAGKP